MREASLNSKMFFYLYIHRQRDIDIGLRVRVNPNPRYRPTYLVYIGLYVGYLSAGCLPLITTSNEHCSAKS
jgi:hypothetical protein